MSAVYPYDNIDVPFADGWTPVSKGIAYDNGIIRVLATGTDDPDGIHRVRDYDPVTGAYLGSNIGIGIIPVDVHGGLWCEP